MKRYIVVLFNRFATRLLDASQRSVMTIVNLKDSVYDYNFAIRRLRR